MTRTTAIGGGTTDDGWPSAAEELGSVPYPWKMVLVTGILSAAFGTAVLVWPDLTVRVMAAFVGVWLLAVGIARIIVAFLPGSGSLLQHVFSAVVGIVLLIAGLVCLSDLGSRLAVLALMFAVTWILSGITEVVVGLQHRGAARLGLVCLGLLSLAAGTVFVLTPELSLTALVVLTGASSLLLGVAEVGLALFLRSRAESAEPIAMSGP